MKHLQVVFIASSLMLFASEVDAVTPQQVTEGFVRGVDDYCLKAISGDRSIAALASQPDSGLSVAPEQQAMMFAPDSKGRAWSVSPGEGIVMVYEPQPGLCKVFAYGPPVAATFSEAVRKAEKSAPGFKRLELNPGYDPIVSGLELAQGDAGIRIEMRGAEPGTPGHAFRFSVLSAIISKTPGASAKIH